MPFPTPPAPQFGAGPSAGSITLFTRQPNDMDDESLRAPLVNRGDGSIARSGRDGIILIWNSVPDTFVDELEDHWSAAQSNGGKRYLKYYSKAGKAMATNQGVFLEPVQRQVIGTQFVDVRLTVLHLGLT